MLTTLLIFLGVLIAMAVVAVLIWSGTHNRLVALDERCESAFADVDVQLKHRANLIPPLVETVRAFARHESDLIAEVVQRRAEAVRASGPNARLEAETQLGNTLNQLMSLAEKYPDLKASDHFRELRAELSDAEHRITAARRFYNLAVSEFNATLRQFPGSMIGGAVHLHRRRPFDLGVERVILDEPVAVSF